MTTVRKEIDLPIRAFTGDRPNAQNRFQVEGQIVRAWDDIAGHYTLCHRLDADIIQWIIQQVNPGGAK